MFSTIHGSLETTGEEQFWTLFELDKKKNEYLMTSQLT